MGLNDVVGGETDCYSVSFSQPSVASMGISESWASVSTLKSTKLCDSSFVRIPGLGRSCGEGKGYPLQYSGLENSMDCIVHGVSKSQTWLSDFHLLSKSEESIWSLISIRKLSIPVCYSCESESSVWLFVTPWTIRSMEISRQEHWSG